MTGVSCNQVRQDFFYLHLHRQRCRVKKLFKELKKILSIDRGAKVILIGAGRIGQALSNYRLFRGRNITVAALFDIKPNWWGATSVARVTKKPFCR